MNKPSGRWPANFVLVHCQDFLACVKCEVIHPIQPIIEVCPSCGGELEFVEGCQWVGVKKVKGDKRGATGGIVQIQPPGQHGIYGIFEGTDRTPAYGDPDGRETVDDWRCAPECPARKLGEQSGESKSSGGSGQTTLEARGRHFKISKGNYPAAGLGGYGDKGTAARFFHQAGWEAEREEVISRERGTKLANVEIVCDDVLHWVETYKGPKFHALLTDCPFEYNFMGRNWDRTGVSFQSSTWSALAEHLLPGAFLFVFAGSRGWHRLACALEDAGLILQPSIFMWGVGVVEVPMLLGHLTGQSFPKASNIHAQLEKTLCQKKGNQWFYKDDGEPMRTEPPFRHPDADKFYGHRYGGQVLKDALSPIVVAQKPWINPRLGCIVDTGAGALWIDGGRVATGDNLIRDCLGLASAEHDGWKRPWHEEAEKKEWGSIQGRWPPNFALCHVPSHKICQSCQVVHPVQPTMEVCPDCGGELERVEGCRRVTVEEVCPGCDGRRFVEAQPIEETWEEWYAKTKDHGGTHEEWERLRESGGSAFCLTCRGEGIVRRVGMKRVKGTNISYDRGNIECIQKLAVPPTKREQDPLNYCDPDGKETVEDWDCRESCPVAKLGEQSGERGCGGQKHIKRESTGKVLTQFSNYSEVSYNDKGTAARFYPQAGWEHEETECSPDCPIVKLGEQSGESGASAPVLGHEPSRTGNRGIYHHYERVAGPFHNDKGTAARFFPQAGWEHEQIECVEECPVVKLDEQAGERKSGGRKGKYRTIGYGSSAHGAPVENPMEQSIGGASRFYPNAGWQYEVAEQLAETDPVHYCPKAAKKERSKGLDDFYWRRDKKNPTGFVRISEEEWGKLDKKERARGNIHSTVKPLSLLKWLASLLLPPPEYAPRRILIPFAGTLSEGIAAALVGWEEVVAVELLRDYCDIAEARAAFWLDEPRQLSLINDSEA